jgi:transposase InsO family protein
MPWKESGVLNLRTEFVLRTFESKVSFRELCGEYGISRKTGYKWKERFLERGIDGLGDRSRRPATSPKQVGEDTTCEIVRLKLAHPKWGPRKIRTVFGRTYPAKDLPSESTFKRILDKAGLVKHCKRRAASDSGRITNRIEAERCNHVWTVDFKGWWRTGDRRRFEPLTVRDAFSRFVLCAQALENNRTQTVRVAFERLFAEYGLPEVIRSDNGTPFAAARSPLGLSRLSAWWLALGINLDRISPARPDQNGAHERMHRDIALEIQGDSAANVVAQQAALDTWRTTYNLERPHEAIGMKVPADLYTPSARPLETELQLDYPVGYLSRRVTSKGIICFRKTHIAISEALAGWDIGLKPERPHRYGLWFCQLRLGEVDMQTQKFYATTTN